jgi:hypothetical protein
MMCRMLERAMRRQIKDEIAKSQHKSLLTLFIL